MEAANRVIAVYLRCFIGDRPREWLRWLPWAEFTYNTAYQSSLLETPFRVVYGRDPPTIRSYEPGDTRMAAVAKTMAERAEFLEDIKHRLEQAQASQKRTYDKSHRPVSYAVGDWVLLRLRQRPMASLAIATKGKLQPRYFSQVSSFPEFIVSCGTWEDKEEFVAKYPAFRLEDEPVVEGGERCHVRHPLHQEEACPRRVQGSQARCSSGPGGAAGDRPTNQWLSLGNRLYACLRFRRELLQYC